MTSTTHDSFFGGLRRHPDVEAPNLQAWDATDRLLLDWWQHEGAPGTRLVVVGDRYGALAVGARLLGAADVRVHQDLITGERALRNNAAAAGVSTGITQLPLGAQLLAGADVVLLQLPKTLAELEEIVDAVARYAAEGAILVAGGRIKHMTLAMNGILGQSFDTVQPQRARQKSRLLVARGLQRPTDVPPYPRVEHQRDLDLEIAAHGAVFAGTKLDIGTRFLLTFMEEMPRVGHAVDLGCGTGILAAMYARSSPRSLVTASDRSAAAVASAAATSAANRLADQIHCLQDDALESLEPASVDLVLLNPPFHLESSVHAGAGLKMFDAAARILRPGGQLWTVYNSHLTYLPALNKVVGATRVKGRNPKFTVALSVRRDDS